MSGTHVFTSAAFNYIGKARALGRSIRQHHPEVVIHLIVAETSDAAPGPLGSDEPFDEVSYTNVLRMGGDPAWLFMHTVVELSTAIKPAFACHLLEVVGAERVVYFDPDVVLFSRLDDVMAALDGASIALTPHLLDPEIDFQAVLDNEVPALRHGTFNLGFFAVRNDSEGGRFAAWWRDRTERLCYDDVPGGLFTDQRWVDLAPGFFEPLAILRSPRLNVAPWNLSRRRVEGSFDAGFRVDGEPMGFYHFTGFDSGAHRRMTNRYAPGNLAVESLVDWYDRYARSLGPTPVPEWTLGRYDDGSPIEVDHRKLYRSRLDLQQKYPDPFRTAGDSFKAWVLAHESG